MQDTQQPFGELRRRKERAEILASMEQMLEQIRQEREGFQSMLEEDSRSMEERVDFALQIGESGMKQIAESNEQSARKMEEKMTRIQREAVATLQRIEESVEESMVKMETRVDISAKSIHTMTMVAAFGFVTVTLAVIVMFVVLLGTL